MRMKKCNNHINIIQIIINHHHLDKNKNLMKLRGLIVLLLGNMKKVFHYELFIYKYEIRYFNIL
jgi:hypothetical protein